MRGRTATSKPCFKCSPPRVHERVGLTYLVGPRESHIHPREPRLDGASGRGRGEEHHLRAVFGRLGRGKIGPGSFWQLRQPVGRRMKREHRSILWKRQSQCTQPAASHLCGHLVAAANQPGGIAAANAARCTRRQLLCNCLRRGRVRQPDQRIDWAIEATHALAERCGGGGAQRCDLHIA